LLHLSPPPLLLLLLQGFDIAKKALLEFLDSFKTPVDPSDREVSSSSSSSQTRNQCKHPVQQPHMRRMGPCTRRIRHYCFGQRF
jgi:hypothetical protein